jgi:hypothetical protein
MDFYDGFEPEQEPDEYAWLDEEQPSGWELAEFCDIVRMTDQENEALPKNMQQPVPEEVNNALIAKAIKDMRDNGVSDITPDMISAYVDRLVGERSLEVAVKDGLRDVFFNEESDGHIRVEYLPAKIYTGQGKYEQEYFASVERNKHA